VTFDFLNRIAWDHTGRNVLILRIRRRIPSAIFFASFLLVKSLAVPLQRPVLS